MSPGRRPTRPFHGLSQDPLRYGRGCWQGAGTSPARLNATPVHRPADRASRALEPLQASASRRGPAQSGHPEVHAWWPRRQTGLRVQLGEIAAEWRALRALAGRSEARAWYDAQYAAEDAAALVEIKKRGMEVNETDIELFRAAVKPVYEKYADQVGGAKLIQAVLDTK
jgi:hypothetical protein